MLKPLSQIALKLLCIKTKKVIIQAPMEIMRQRVMCYNSYKHKVGKLKCIIIIIIQVHQ